MEHFATFDEIFADDMFEILVEGIRPKTVERIDPDMEKFQEILDWVSEHHREPQKTTHLTERKLWSRLKGIRASDDKRSKLSFMDTLGLLDNRDD